VESSLHLDPRNILVVLNRHRTIPRPPEPCQVALLNPDFIVARLAPCG
jgi:hypothetical protein